MNTVNLILLIAMAALCIVSMVKLRVKTPNLNALHNFNASIRFFINKYHVILIIVIMLVAIAVRAYKFGIIPYGFNQDEAMAALEGMTLSDYGTDHFGMSYPVYFTAWVVSQMNVLLSYVMIPFFKIFGVSVFTARLPLLVFSALSLWVIYRFSARLFGKNAALAVLFFTAVNPWQIMASRWALEANLFPHFMLYGAYLLYLGVEKRRVYIYISMLVFGIAMYSYGISYYAVPILLIILCIYLIYTKAIKLRHAALCLLCYLIVSGPIFLMTAVNYFKWDTIEMSFLTIPFFEDGQRMGDILIFSEDIYSQFVSNFNSLMNAAFFQTADLPWNSIPEYGPLYFCSIPLFITGLLLMIVKYRKERRTGIFLILMLFMTAFISGLITNNVNINRTNIIFFPMIILIGYAIYVICKRFNFLVFPIAISFIMLFTGFTSEYFNGKHSTELGSQFYYGFGDALEYIREKDYDYNKIYITINTQGTEAYFTTEILALFHLQIDNKYYHEEAVQTRLDGTDYPSYERRYRYRIDPEAIYPEEETDTVYVIHESELSYFDNFRDYYDFTQFGSYYAVVHKEIGS